MLSWWPVTQLNPRAGETAYLYRQGDLYPVVGSRLPVENDSLPDLWLLEEGGAEDGDHRRYPHIAEGAGWEPTHYAPIDDLPVDRAAQQPPQDKETP